MNAEERAILAALYVHMGYRWITCDGYGVVAWDKKPIKASNGDWEEPSDGANFEEINGVEALEELDTDFIYEIKAMLEEG